MENISYNFRKATVADCDSIWKILQQAIERRRQDGSRQWQDGYPNFNSVASDVEKGWGFVIDVDGEIAAYAALIFEAEPAYESIEGKWLSSGDYLVLHRAAVADAFAGKGLAKMIFREAEKLAKSNGINSVKVDTNFDNAAMLAILEKSGYTYCGEVSLRGNARKAFEKLLG